MSKWMPSVIISLFAVAVILRIGDFGFQYYGQWLSVHAATKTAPKESAKKTPSVKKDHVINVQDKILQTNNYKLNKTNFSTEKASKIIDNNPKKVCITGSMLKDAIKQLNYLDKQQKDITEQKKLLEVSDRRIREQIAKLKIIKNDIVESAKLADSKIQKESKRLISIYEKMKPKEAAKIFNEMSPAVAAELLRTMKEDQSSQILSKMDPKMAYDVTLSLAGGIKRTKDKYNTIR